MASVGDGTAGPGERSNAQGHFNVKKRLWLGVFIAVAATLIVWATPVHVNKDLEVACFWLYGIRWCGEP